MTISSIWFSSADYDISAIVSPHCDQYHFVKLSGVYSFLCPSVKALDHNNYYVIAFICIWSNSNCGVCGKVHLNIHIYTSGIKLYSGEWFREIQLNAHSMIRDLMEAITDRSVMMRFAINGFDEFLMCDPN